MSTWLARACNADRRAALQKRIDLGILLQLLEVEQGIADITEKEDD